MIRALPLRLIRIVPAPVVTMMLALVVALAGFASARQMAPDPAMLVWEQTAYVLGVPVDDICGDAAHDHASHCPFCHLLPEAPEVGHMGRAGICARDMGLAPLGDLTIAPSARRAHRLARAPPALA
ncbi:hypothetical protein [Pseudooceanicola algae]|uniref:DUF2946 domain-containing protein n=1 Tax=Pseudooceanicola algae TaxID=1537215 RepID=A0A418SIT4_9RHOB|nr:hypothetical protein [Pseudooceanicola algae]QPM91208.1 hypothetical protein PSAL_024580 [Pseudooceanicola algae]